MDALERRIRQEANIRLDCLPEEMSIEGNAMTSGDAKVDAECCAEIRGQLEDGNDWAWCTVRVTAEWEDLEGVDYLGGCSYESEEDFKRPGGCFDDMKEAALMEVIAKARKIVKAAHR